MLKNLLDLIVGPPAILKLVTVSRQIAADSHSEVWERVRPLVFDMELAVARGYVRTRGKAVIRKHTRSAFSGRPLSSQSRQLIVAMAIERVVHDVIAELIADAPQRRQAA